MKPRGSHLGRPLHAVQPLPGDSKEDVAGEHAARMRCAAGLESGHCAPEGVRGLHPGGRPAGQSRPASRRAVQ
jgi:hypothetical protein